MGFERVFRQFFADGHESKINKTVTVEHLQKEFRKMITEEILTSKLETLKQDLKTHLHKELEKVYDRIKDLERNQLKHEQEITDLKNKVSDLETDRDNVKTKYDQLKQSHDKLDARVGEMEKLAKVNAKNVNEVEQYTRRNNIRIYGIDDRNKNESAEDTITLVLKFLKSKLDVDLERWDIDIAHRMGRFSTAGNRILICRFVSRLHRNIVISKRRVLKGSQFIIREDLTNKNAKLLENASAVSNVKSAWTDQGKVLVELDTGKKMQVTLLTDLSGPLHPEPEKKDDKSKKTTEKEAETEKRADEGTDPGTADKRTLYINYPS